MISCSGTNRGATGCLHLCRGDVWRLCPLSCVRCPVADFVGWCMSADVVQYHSESIVLTHHRMCCMWAHMVQPTMERARYTASVTCTTHIMHMQCVRVSIHQITQECVRCALHRWSHYNWHMHACVHTPSCSRAGSGAEPSRVVVSSYNIQRSSVVNLFTLYICISLDTCGMFVQCVILFGQ